MILAHLSDFHLRPDYSEICLQKLKQIKECIDQYKVDIVVYTGDIVDFRYIGNDKEKLLESFNFAHKAFKILTDNSDLQKFVFCPGNHDIIRQDVEKISSCEMIDENSDIYIQAFEYYNSFLHEMGLSQFNHQTYLKQISVRTNTFNFLVANTNWLRENNYSKNAKNCINCYKVSELINSGKLDTDINKNIFVSHLPIDYVCECAKYSYEGYNANLAEEIYKNFGMLLAGDKHTSSSTNTFIIGNPLYEEESIISIHRINGSRHTLDIIKILEGETIIISDKETSNKILRLCDKYITDNARRIISANNSNKYNLDAIDSFFLEDKTALKNIENIYSKVVNFKQYDEQTQKFTKRIKKISFSEIAKQIADYDGDNKNIINLRGAHETGKSTFLSWLFMFLLFYHKNKQFKYFPLYFNITYHRMKGENREEIQKQFEQFINKGKQISKEIKKPPCFIIDGLNQYCMFGDEPDLGTSLENAIKDKIFNIQDSKIILSIDTFSQPIDFHKSVFDYPTGVWKSSKLLLYFNSIRTIPENELELTELIENIKAIKKDETSDTKRIIKKLFSESIIELSLMFLYNYYKEFDTSNNNILYTINSFCQNKMLDHSNKLNKAKGIALDIYINRKTFADMTMLHSKKDYIRLFEYIKNHKTFSNYLFAVNYVDEIKRLVSSSQNNKTVAAKNIVNIVFPQEVFYSIRQEFEVKKGKTDITICLERVLSKNITKFDDIGIANLVYLLGDRIGIKDKPLIGRIKKRHKSKNNNIDSFKNLILQRTACISEIMICEGSGLKKAINYYLNALMSSPEIRFVNRIFHRMYYQDTYNLMRIDDMYEMLDNEEKGNVNFDFYFTYQTLIMRINGMFDNSKRNLLEINLFTLCDLISSRLRIRYNSNDEVTFFYNQAKKNTVLYILNESLKLIEKYLVKYESYCNNPSFISFLRNCQRDFKLFPAFLDTEHEEVFMHPSLIINQLNILKNKERQGWLIKDKHKKRSLSEEEYINQKQNNSIETVVEHIYYTYLIGLLFLPEKSSEYPRYNKQKILNMILIHDVGESFVGDSSPYMTNYDEIKEREDLFNKTLFSSWMYIKDTCFVEQMDLWNTWYRNNTDDINYQIARELDVIQLLYEFNTINDKEQRFSEERIKEFNNMEISIETSISRKVFEIVVKTNKHTSLSDFWKELGYNVDI